MPQCHLSDEVIDLRLLSHNYSYVGFKYSWRSSLLNIDNVGAGLFCVKSKDCKHSYSKTNSLQLYLVDSITIKIGYSYS